MNVAPLVSLRLAGSRLVEEAVAVLEATHDNKLMLAVAAELNDSRPHTTLWHFRDLFAFFKRHVRFESDQATLLNEGFVGELECQVGPFIQHVEELEVDFIEAELVLVRLSDLEELSALELLRVLGPAG